jgi:RND superfamily putative drug exporter
VLIGAAFVGGQLLNRPTTAASIFGGPNFIGRERAKERFSMPGLCTWLEYTVQWRKAEFGIGHQLFGFQQTTTVQSWVPIFLFCILFGLSMDYHVFLLSRIREHYVETGKNKESVAVGLRATSRIITGAAAIMIVVFATFAAGNLVMLQQLGFGLAVAVLLDATLIRSILVPASMALLGRMNWYLPAALRRILPRLQLEGPRTKPVIPPA